MDITNWSFVDICWILKVEGGGDCRGAIGNTFLCD